MISDLVTCDGFLAGVEGANCKFVEHTLLQVSDSSRDECLFLAGDFRPISSESPDSESDG